jgi:tRNA-dihydrouridine synthase
VDGVLLGRAAQGNPWVFAGKGASKSGCTASPLLREPLAPALPERFRVIIEHCEHFEKWLGTRNFVAMRKHLTWYCREFRGAAELRSRMTRMTSAREVAACLAEFLRLGGADILPGLPIAWPVISEPAHLGPWGSP